METDFLNELKKYQSKAVFNIFSVVVNRRETLHSSFIAELLNPKGLHGYKSQFLKCFFEEINYNCNLNLDEFEVKTEFDIKNNGRIDIFIVNQVMHQCIVIENKIDAIDQKFQLCRYRDFCSEEKYNYKLFYLTPRGKKASKESTCGILQDGQDYYCVSYEKHINQWLSKCLGIITNDDRLKDVVDQYITFLKDEIVNDVALAKNLKNMIANNINIAWENKKEIVNMNIFKHVKWHTVDDFFQELSQQLKIQCPELKIQSPDLGADITKVTHKKEGQISNTRLILRVLYKENEIQVVNDSKGFTLGNLTTNKWGLLPVQKIVFADFSNQDTFKLINDAARKQLINCILDAINDEVSLHNICLLEYLKPSCSNSN